MRLSSIPRVTGNHRKRWLMANSSRMETRVERKWRLVRGRVVFTCRGGRVGRKMRTKVRIFVAEGRCIGGFAAFKESPYLKIPVELTLVCPRSDVFFV